MTPLRSNCGTECPGGGQVEMIGDELVDEPQRTERCTGYDARSVTDRSSCSSKPTRSKAREPRRGHKVCRAR